MPRTTIDLSRGTFDGLKRYCNQRRLSMRKASELLISRGLKEEEKPRRAKRVLPSLPLALTVDPADRDALYARMEGRS